MASQGPIVWENWKASENGAPHVYAYEFPLFTDAIILGQQDDPLGPYYFINTVSHTPTKSLLEPAIVARVKIHIEEKFKPHAMDKTDDKRYHGGDLTDELAALLSLILGIRLRPGAPTREFTEGGDPLGLPIGYKLRNMPALSASIQRPLLPRAKESHNLVALKMLEKFIHIEPDGATALVKASRQYQEAIWISEADPSLSWQYMISAVETAADYWKRSSGTAVERLKESKPELYSLLKERGGQEHVSMVAKLIVDSLGATKKFIDFLITFLPEPPSDRPSPAGQMSFDEENVRKALRIVYRCRSRSLHGGIPFPLPMCEPPMWIDDSKIPVEVPAGLATSSRGGVWRHEDSPIHLHIFEHMVRGALNSWWLSLPTHIEDGS